MLSESLQRNVLTFISLLSAFDHAGLIEEGQRCFESMNTHCHIIPNLEVRSCMVDMLSRAGHFDKAMYMIEKMPASDCLPLWSVLLGACQIWGNVEIGQWASDHVLRQNGDLAGAYVCMCTIYATAGMQKK
ncbi:hypothetical protein KP509_10G013000 [Ceratopteris richardii]|uniref:Pentatricopeptide repeat-containing protein n=1 Tax=Ceratopteris richardii TaxID=49495 RepID=A0A8T2TSW5_CERRI|nr:hypothetical protein KP509_10G013000 [Ceratopteris richardii]